MPADWGCPVWDVWEEPGLFHPGAQEAPFPIQPVWDVYIPAPPRALTLYFPHPPPALTAFPTQWAESQQHVQQKYL